MQSFPAQGKQRPPFISVRENYRPGSSGPRKGWPLSRKLISSGPARASAGLNNRKFWTDSWRWKI
jgi:hypothetical protein